jgi:hypothetical protein
MNGTRSYGNARWRRVARGLLLLGAVTSLGCIVPTPLHTVEQPQNYPPVFVDDLCTPRFITTIQPAQSGTGALVSPTLVVDDLDAGSGASNGGVPEQLTARLFKLNDDGSLTFELLETSLTVPNALLPQRFEGTLPPTAWCQTFVSTPGASLNMVVIVADRPFYPQGSGKENQVQGVMTDGGIGSENTAQAGWKVSCP